MKRPSRASDEPIADSSRLVRFSPGAGRARRSVERTVGRDSGGRARRPAAARLRSGVGYERGGLGALRVRRGRAGSSVTGAAAARMRAALARVRRAGRGGGDWLPAGSPLTSERTPATAVDNVART